MVFLLASFTDYLDGRLAREKGLVTNFGKLVDPIADKVLTLSAFLAFVEMHLVPSWMVILILTRDFLITGLRLFLPQGESQAARVSGKNKTALQFIVIVGILFYLALKESRMWDAAWTMTMDQAIYWAMLLVVGFTLWSGFRFAYVNRAPLAQAFRNQI